MCSVHWICFAHLGDMWVLMNKKRYYVRGNSEITISFHTKMYSDEKGILIIVYLGKREIYELVIYEIN